MAMRVASLGDAAINLSLLRDDAHAELTGLLDSLPGSKCLVLDSFIGGLLKHVLPEGSRLLKEKGVMYFRELRSGLGGYFNSDGQEAEPDHIIYLVRPSIPHVKLIAEQIRTRSKVVFDYRYKVHFVPQRTLICEQIFREENVLRKIDIGEFPLDLVPFEKDVLSLELDQVFRECHLDGDTGSLTTLARSIQKLQAMFGRIPNVKTKGCASRAVAQKLLQMTKEERDHAEDDGDYGDDDVGGYGDYPDVGEIDTLVLIDREVDLATAMVSPLTYEGLIDELIGIHNGFVKLDADVLGDDKADTPKDASSQDGKKDVAEGEEGGRTAAGPRQVAIPLNSNDPLFGVVRDLNVEQLGSFLQNKAKEIRASYSSFRENRDQSISEIHDFVKRIPGLTQNYKSLTQHINIAELIKKTTDSTDFRERWQTERSMLEGENCYDTLEEAISTQCSPLRVLRLLCLQSITSGGIKSNKYEAIKRDFVQTYGYEHLFTLSNLERVGLLERKEREMSWVDSGSSSWATLRKSLRLIRDNVNVHSPDDIAYVSSGYAPLSVRLVQAAARPGGWDAVAEVMKMLPGPTHEFEQYPGEFVEDLADAQKRHDDTASKRLGTSSPQQLVNEALSGSGVGGAGRKKVMLVYFVGGLTFMEIAAMRFLSRQREFPFEIIMATTKIINGDIFISALMPNFENNLHRE